MQYQVYDAWSKIPPQVAASVEQILQEAFPESERRDLAEIRNCLESAPLQLLTASRESQVLAVLLVWNLPDVTFLENFAVRADCRGQGIGAELLHQVSEIWKKPQVLEVEIPQTELQRRRIAFYQRCGFFLNETYPYRMPNLHGDGPAMPLHLMSKPHPLTDDQAAGMERILWEQAYFGKKLPEKI